MNTLTYILLFTFLGSIVSLIGGFVLLSQGKFAGKISHFLAAFAAGVLLGTAFLDLLPEAFDLELEKTNYFGGEVFGFALIGILFFFLLERFIYWFHHHHDHKEISGNEKKTAIPLIVLGDTFHNFIDGIVIAATFLVDIKLGMITSLAVAAHEIPQELGDFGLMLHRGLSKSKILTVNLISAAFAILGAVITFFLGDIVEGILPALLSLAAGFFIYIALSDLIPEIHGEDRKDVAFWETVLLLLGVVVIWLAVVALEQLL